MTTQDSKEKLSKILWENSQITGVSFEGRDSQPSNRGHGLYLKTLGNDVAIDLRLCSQKPFWGHTHPLIVKFNLGLLETPSKANYYSVPKTEFTRMLETFQKVDIFEIASPTFQITYHNVVIFIDEKILDFDIEDLTKHLQKLVRNNPETFFWIVEKDISLLSEEELFFSHGLFSESEKHNIHFCLDLHFLPSTLLVSHHLFSEDSSINIFLAMNEYFDNIVSSKILGKIVIDNELIDNFISKNPKFKNVKKIGRYLILPRKISPEEFFKNGILITPSQAESATILAIPLSCTNEELLDTLNRISITLD